MTPTSIVSEHAHARIYEEYYGDKSNGDGARLYSSDVHSLFLFVVITGE